MTADRIILGGLNEGVWPGDAPIDPFLSRPMRAEIGLPSPERRIGLAAHDFAQLASQPDVVLTRAAKNSGAPARPSRWILRLKNILVGADALDPIDETPRYAAWARAPDDAGPPSPVSPPRFAPPLEARPSTLYVTRIGKLLRDPYGVYASQVLKLKKRDPLGDPFGPRHIGNLFHAVFERFAAAHPKDMPADATTALLRLFDDAADHHGMTPADRVFWRRASLAALEWFAGFHADRLDRGEPAVIEGDGAWAFDIDGARFTLRARADRIDATGTGGFTVFDYKSKTLPSIDQIKSDFNPQLPLTALIAERGGFDALKNAAVEGFFYLRVLDRRAARGKADVGLDGAAAVEAVRAAEEGLRSLIAHYRNPQTPYLSQPRPEFLDDWGDYDHLARRREWSASGGEE